MIENIKIRLKKSVLLFNHIREYIGKKKVDTTTNNDGWHDANVSDGISEYNFYLAYLMFKRALTKTYYIDNEDDADVLFGIVSDVNLQYMALIMSKPLDYTMSAMSKNNVQHDLAVELGRTDKSVHIAITRLKNAGYLEVTEDNLIVPNSELRKLREVCKSHLEKQGVFPLAYTIEFIVDGSKERTKT